MKAISSFALIIIALLTSPSFAEPGEKTKRYHQVLLKRPEDANLLSRFVQTWDDEESEGEPVDWLIKRVEKKGTAADFRVLAALHESEGRDKEALEVLMEAVKKFGNDTPLLLARAQARARLLAYEAALMDLDLIKGDPDLERKAMTLKGTWLLRAGKASEAVEAWQAAVKKFPEDEAFREDLIEILLVESLHEQAASAQQELIKMTRDPYQKALRNLRLAEIQLLALQEAEGLATYEAVMTASGPGTWLEREVLAQVERFFLRSDDIQALRDYFQKLREKHPRRIAIHKALALQMARNGELPEAVQLFREVIQITPGDLGNREELISFLEEFQKYEEARIELRTLLEQREDDIELWKRMVTLETTLRNPNGARDAIGKIRALLPEDAGAVEELARLYVGAHLPEEAENTLREGIESWPEADELVVGYARILIDRNDLPAAKKIWMEMAASGDREKVLTASMMMRRHKMPGEAFEVLMNRVGDFDNDALFLEQLCSVANEVAQARRVVPHSLTLVRLAQGASDLENSVATAVKVILRARALKAVIEDLEKLTPATTNDLALLAELHVMGGRVAAGRRALAAIGDDPIGKLFEVRFEEQRGEFERAIGLLRKIIKFDGGRKPVLLRRMVQLHRSARDLEGALTAVDEWRRVAPGDPQAWMTRVNLLLQLKRPEKAVRELRRMVMKFGPGDGRRAKLASAEESAGNLRAALKVYEQLYNDAEGENEKLKWADRWASMAIKQGRVLELVEYFERRARKNPRSIIPLLGLAIIREKLGDAREAREVLEEAARRRPDDAELLIRIAKFENGRNRFRAGKKWLEKAIKIERGSRAKQLLANQLLKEKKFDECLALLETIPAEGGDPRRIEAMVEDLIRFGHRRKAVAYLDRLLPQHHHDWRLVYLRGVLHRQAGEVDEAARRFAELESAKMELPGYPTPTEPVTAAGLPISWTPEMKEVATLWLRMTDGSFHFIDFENRAPHLVRGYTSSLFTLPASVGEARLRGLLQRVILKQYEADEVLRKQATLDLLAGLPVDLAIVIKAELEPEILREELEQKLTAGAAEIRHAVMWMRVSKAGAPRGGNVLEAAAAVLLNDSPAELIELLADASQSRGLAPARVLELSRQAFAALDPEARSMSLGTLSRVGRQFPPFSNEAKVFQEDLLRSISEMELSEDVGDFPGLERMIHEVIASGDGQLAVKLFNQWIRLGSSNHGIMQQGQSLRMQEGLELVVRGRDITRFMKRYSRLSVGRGEAAQRRDEIHRLLGTRSAEKSVLSLKTLLPHLGEIENPVARGMILHAMELDEELNELISNLPVSGDVESVLFVSGVHQSRGDLHKAYAALSALPENSITNDLELRANEYLLSTAAQLVEKGADPAGFDRTQDAINRVVRYVDHDDLYRVMVILGKTVSRNVRRLQYTQLRQTNQRVTVQGLRNRRASRQGSPISSDAALQLIYRESDLTPTLDAACRCIRASKYYRPDYGNEVERIMIFIMRKNLEEKVLALLKPKPDAGAEEFARHARIAHDLDQPGFALEAWNKVLIREPGNPVARVGQFIESKADQRDWSLFSRKKSGPVAEQNLGVFFKDFAPSLKDDRTLAKLGLQIVIYYLAELDDDLRGSTALSWVGGFLNEVSRYVVAQDSAQVGPELVVQLCRAMITERATTGAAMRLLIADHALLNVLNLSQETMRTLAEESLRTVLTTALRKTPPGEFVRWKGSGHEADGEASLTFLARDRALRTNGPLLSEDLWKLLAEHRPADHALLTAAIAGDLKALKAALPADPKARSSKAILAAYALVTAPEVPEMTDFSAEVAKAVLSERDAQISDVWFSRLLQENGSSGVTRWLDALTTAALGDEERQALLLELGLKYFPDPDREQHEKLGENLEELAGSHGDLVLDWLAASRIAALYPELPERHFEEVSGRLLIEGSGWFEKNDLLKSRPEAARVSYLLDVLETLEKSREGNWERIANIGRAVRANENYDAFLRELVAHKTASENELATVIGNYPDLLRELEKTESLRLLQILQVLYRDLPSSEIPELLGQSLARLKARNHETDLKMLRDLMAKNGGKMTTEQGLAWDLIAKNARHDPGHAAQAIEEIIGNNLAAGTRLMVTDPKKKIWHLNATDRWVREALKPLLKGESKADRLSNIKVINRLMRGKLAPDLLAARDGILKHDKSLGEHFEELLTEVAHHERRAHRAEVLIAVLRPLLAGLTVEERQTMAVLYLDKFAYFLGGDSATAERDVVWINENLPKEFPSLVDYFSALRLSSFDPKDDELAKRISDHWASWLKQADFNTPLAMDAAAALVTTDRLRSGLVTENLWSWITTALRNYHQRMPEKFTPLKFGTLDFRVEKVEQMGEVANDFLDLAGEIVLLEDDENNYSQNRLRRNISERLLPLAIERKRSGAVKNFVSCEPSRSHGDLSRIVTLAEAGEYAAAATLVARKNYPYQLTKVLFFKKQTEQYLPAFLEALPEEARYRAEVVLSALPDAEGEDAPGTAWEERLSRLAPRFAKEGPDDPLPRLEILAYLAQSGSAFDLLDKEIRTIEQELSYASVSGSNEDYQTIPITRQLILAVIARDLKKQDNRSFNRHFSAFHKTKAANRWDLSDGVGDLLTVFKDHCWQSLQDDPNPTDQALRLSEQMRLVHQQLLNSKRELKKPLIRQATALSYSLHCLAGTPEVWEKWLGELIADEKNAQTKTLGRESLLALMPGLRSPAWDNLEGEIRKSLGTALLTDVLIQQGLPEDHPGVIKRLTEEKLFKKEELIEIIDALPPETIALPLYLWQRSIWEGDAEKALSTLKKAYRLANERKSKGAPEMLQSLIRAHLATGQKAEAAALLKTIDRSGMSKAKRIRLEELEEALK